ncbi:MAG: Txe/YoeB family addiction module toxin [Bacteroidales bacterium]|nr:Txe/YoeB family addiction module toxin [Bacteroidales bacterium]
MELKFTETAQRDLEWWREYGDVSSKRKISRLLTEISEHPTTGTGRPELLTGDMAGCWSRRINHKDRIVYEIRQEAIFVMVLSMRGHYSDK